MCADHCNSCNTHFSKNVTIKSNCSELPWLLSELKEATSVAEFTGSRAPMTAHTVGTAATAGSSLCTCRDGCGG